MKNWMAGTALIAGLSIATSVGVFAHSGATGVVKERMDLMGSLGKTTERLTSMMRGKVPYDAEKVREMAKIIGGHGGEALTRLFPKDSIQGPSKATPDIWKDWERFREISDDLKSYAGALEKAAGNPRPKAGRMGMPPPATMGGGMMGPDQRPGSMMGDSVMGQEKPGQGMMGNPSKGPSPEQLASMPPDATYLRVLGTCSACHQDFRKKR